VPLDPTVKALIEVMEANWPDLEHTPAAQVRETTRANNAAAAQAGPPPREVAKVEDRSVEGPGGPIPVRIYWPLGATGTPPLVVYFHGGGWVICDLDSHDAGCRALANETGSVVVSVDYRLAPEHRYPAAPEDSYAATVWAAEHATELGADANRLGVAGDSAGGNLAAVVALMARDRHGPPLRFQLLVYPVTDVSPGRDRHPSQTDNATGYFLTTTGMDWFRAQYLPEGEDGSDPYASPFMARDVSGLPPAFIVTAEFDPLRDEGEAYGAKLAAAGVPVETLRAEGLFHGFFGMGELIGSVKPITEQAFAAVRTGLAD
jgi:acetyl esterase